MDYTEWEVRNARRMLESLGFIVRKPGEANMLVNVRVVEIGERSHYELPLRIDTELNGTPYALGEHFRVDMILDEEYRKNYLPKAFARKLGHYISDRIMESLPVQMEKALAPMVAAAEEARDRMSLSEITTFIERALNDPTFDADAWDADRLEKRRSKGGKGTQQ